MIALSTCNGQAPQDRRDDLPETLQFIGDAMLACNVTPNVAQRGDALALLQSLRDSCTQLVFFDAQRGL
jgi:hypothetical protein